ncbi:flagellar protein FliS, partial [Acetomicrobium sp. S15 = DSM 107314]|uniref:flagellar protein FliS n=1 Tax=Acetomicrobium sp. S15 = DSM 107314 TaxID=2529858 RepID=UPI0018E1D66D
TASKEKLLLLTYDIGIRSCAVAEEAISKKDRESANTHLQRAQRVIRAGSESACVSIPTKIGPVMPREALYSHMA